MHKALPRQSFTHPSHSIYRHWPHDVPPACNRFGLSDGSSPECAVTAQIAHSKYAAQYARSVHIRVRTGSRFALRFAPSYANLVRTRPPACYQKSWLPGVGFHYGFQCFAVVSTESRLIKRTKSTIRTCHKVIKDQPTSLRISFTSDLVLVTVTSCMLPIGSKE